MNVCIGLTASRRECGSQYLTGLCASLQPQADLSKVVCLAEPGTEQVPGLCWIYNSTRLGNWHNWLALARHMLASNDDAQAYLLCEDDVVFAADAVERLAQMLPAVLTVGSFGYLSLYTSGTHKQRVRAPRGSLVLTCGKQQAVCEHVKRLWGACAMVFTRDSLQAIVNHPKALSWQGLPEDAAHRHEHGTAAITGRDIIINEVTQALSLRSWFLRPSAVQHVGECSSLGNNQGLTTGRRSTDYTASLQ